MRRLRAEAARSGTTMSALAEAGLRSILGDDTDSEPTLDAPPTWHSGGTLVDIADRDALYAAMEGR